MQASHFKRHLLVARARTEKVGVHGMDFSARRRGRARGGYRLAEHLAAEGTTMRGWDRGGREDVVSGSSPRIDHGEHRDKVGCVAQVNLRRHHGRYMQSMCWVLSDGALGHAFIAPVQVTQS